MTRTTTLVAAALLVGCKDKGDDSGTVEEGCGVAVVSSVPASDAADAYYRADIEFELSLPDSTAVASLADSDGNAVAGTSWLNDNSDTVYFTPDEPLTPGADYVASLSFCAGNPTVGFRTSSLGQDLSADIVGKTYELDLASARFVQPEGIGAVLASQMTMSILLGVTSAEATADGLQIVGAISEEGTTNQDYCNPSIPFPSADFTGSPFFEIGPEDTNITVADISIDLLSLVVNGTFASDGSYFGGGVLSGTVDTRPLVSMIDEEGGDDYICELAVGFGAQCEACPSDGGEFCLTLVADQIVATELPGTVLEEIELEDCHEMCAASATNPDCDLSGGGDDTGAR